MGKHYKQEFNELNAAVRMRGFVDDLAAEYDQADVVICPITSGGGTQIKAIEALMSSRSTVVSDFSYRGFADVLVPGEHLLVARDDEERVRHVGDVLRNPDRFAAMAERGHQAVGRTYSVEAFAQRVVDTFRQRSAGLRRNGAGPLVRGPGPAQAARAAQPSPPRS